MPFKYLWQRPVSNSPKSTGFFYIYLNQDPQTNSLYIIKDEWSCLMIQWKSGCSTVWKPNCIKVLTTQWISKYWMIPIFRSYEGTSTSTERIDYMRKPNSITFRIKSLQLINALNSISTKTLLIQSSTNWIDTELLTGFHNEFWLNWQKDHPKHFKSNLNANFSFLQII